MTSSNSEPNPKPFSVQSRNQKRNQFRNEFRIQFENQFENKFGINSRKNMYEFLEKNPDIWDGILDEVMTEFLIENPVVATEIFDRFLDRIATGFSGKKVGETEEEK